MENFDIIEFLSILIVTVIMKALIFNKRNNKWYDYIGVMAVATVFYLIIINFVR